MCVLSWLCEFGITESDGITLIEHSSIESPKNSANQMIFNIYALELGQALLDRSYWLIR